MNQFAKSTAAFMFFVSIAQAQPQATSTLSGQWAGAIKSSSTENELQIQVNISDLTGTWRYIAPTGAKRPNPCFGRELPLSIKTLPNAMMVFSVDGASVVNGCPSFALTLERKDEQTLSGTFKDGRPAVLKKQ